MKKYCYTILLIILTAILLVITVNQNYQNSRIRHALAVQETKYPAIYDSLNSLTISNFQEKLSSGNTFLAYFGRPSCSDCKSFEPRIVPFLNKRKFKNFYYINISKIHENKNAWNTFSKKTGIKYTPTVAYFYKGKLKDSSGWTPKNGVNVVNVKKFILKYSKKQSIN